MTANYSSHMRAKFILHRRGWFSIQCIDCGEWFEVDKNNVKTYRCPKCNIEHNRELRRLQTRRYRENKKCSS